MKRNHDMKRIAFTVLSASVLIPSWGVAPNDIKIENPTVTPVGDVIKVTADVNLDDVKLGRNRQIYLTPVLEDGSGNSEVLPSVLVNGHAMHIAYERGALSGDELANHNVGFEVKRNNGKQQTVDYVTSVELQKWMWSNTARLRWVVDDCGCGHLNGSEAGPIIDLGLNPTDKMRVAYVTPAVTPLPITIHEGKAKVQYEVNKSVLHDEPYVCRNGQLIDNRLELKVIDDSVSHALSDKNMEIAMIRICGYASPDGPYLNNERLSAERSRSLAEYLADRYKLPEGRSEYDAVAENWEGFLKIVEEDTYLKPEIKDALTALINRLAYGPSDYDDKENELKTSPEFRKIYNEVILPDWFPTLRTTKFEISTRLKPLSDEELAVVFENSPEKMSLNQMFRVAKLYPEGSDEFNAVISKTLKYYGDDPTANLNAAAAALKAKDYDRAEQLLRKAGSGPEVENALGILESSRGEMDKAREHFRNAASLPEAAKNLEMLGGGTTSQK